MNNTDSTYRDFSLVKEMLETGELLRRLGGEAAAGLSVSSEKILLTGEGSSRIFPAAHIAYSARVHRYSQFFLVEGALQGREYDLRDFHIFVASNSGKTAEAVKLVRSLRQGPSGTPVSGVTALVGDGSAPLADMADEVYTLRCGGEEAVAATKSVVEQALLYDSLFRRLNGREEIPYGELADMMEKVLKSETNQLLVDRLALAPKLYFAGRNNGVAEELTLKTNEIIRRPSDYLEGTYAVHGIEEVMHPNEAIILIDPWEDEEEKFHQVLERGVGLSVIAISSRETTFPTLRIPEAGDLSPYLQLAAGWNILVEVGLRLGINIDTPARARKIGNEFTG